MTCIDVGPESDAIYPAPASLLLRLPSAPYPRLAMSGDDARLMGWSADRDPAEALSRLSLAQDESPPPTRITFSGLETDHMVYVGGPQHVPIHIKIVPLDGWRVVCNFKRADAGHGLVTCPARKEGDIYIADRVVLQKDGIYRMQVVLVPDTCPSKAYIYDAGKVLMLRADPGLSGSARFKTMPLYLGETRRGPPRGGGSVAEGARAAALRGMAAIMGPTQRHQAEQSVERALQEQQAQLAAQAAARASGQSASMQRARQLRQRRAQRTQEAAMAAAAADPAADPARQVGLQRRVYQQAGQRFQRAQRALQDQQTMLQAQTEVLDLTPRRKWNAKHRALQEVRSQTIQRLQAAQVEYEVAKAALQAAGQAMVQSGDDPLAPTGDQPFRVFAMVLSSGTYSDPYYFRVAGAGARTPILFRAVNPADPARAQARSLRLKITGGPTLPPGGGLITVYHTTKDRGTFAWASAHYEGGWPVTIQIDMKSDFLLRTLPGRADGMLTVAISAGRMQYRFERGWCILDAHDTHWKPAKGGAFPMEQFGVQQGHVEFDMTSSRERAPGSPQVLVPHGASRIVAMSAPGRGTNLYFDASLLRPDDDDEDEDEG